MKTSHVTFSNVQEMETALRTDIANKSHICLFRWVLVFVLTVFIMEIGVLDDMIADHDNEALYYATIEFTLPYSSVFPLFSFVGGVVLHEVNVSRAALSYTILMPHLAQGSALWYLDQNFQDGRPYSERPNRFDVSRMIVIN